MTVWQRTKPWRGDGDHGFTLVELIIAMTLSLLVGGVVVAGLLTSLNVSSSTTDQVSDSTDAGLITAYLIRDAQSAGGVVPTTAVRTTLGVSTGATAWDGCSQAPATLVVRFSWNEWSAAQVAQPKVVVTYAFDGTSKLLTRRMCLGGSTTGPNVVLARDLISVTATCSPVCTSLTTTPTTMWLDVTGSGTRAPLVYRLKAAVRGDVQTAPTIANSAPVPLLALGAGSSVICPNVDLAGTGAVTVIGDVVVDKLCGASPVKDDLALLRPTGTTRMLAGVVNPFLARVKPSFTCNATGVNPATIGVSATPSTVVRYDQIVTVTADTFFQPGRFVFCKGLTFTSGSITGTNVLLYIHAGSFDVKSAATVNLTGQTTNDKKMLVWSNQVNTPIKVAGGPKVSNYRGLFYAPTSEMEVSSVLGLNIEGINTQGLTVTGAGQARLGVIPAITFLPATLAAGQVNIAYSKTVTASGGTAAYTWSATGLPAGLSMSTTGVISGTPTTAGTSSVVVTVFDSTKASASIDYSLTINAALSIASTPILPNGQVGLTYATTTLTPVGGTAPYSWTQTGLPNGLVISATGVVSGTPTVAGSFPVTVTVTDAYTSAQRSYTVVIVGPLAVAGPALPDGQVGVTYPTTTVTATGGSLPYAWTSTGLPPGLTMNPATGAVSGTPTTSGTYSVVVTVTDSGSRTAQATYPVTITLQTECPTTATPWKAQYYPTATLSGTPVLRDDAEINFNWATGSPIAGIPADNFSVRWTKTMNFAAGNYTFVLNTDDGSRMYIDDVLVAPLNSWTVSQSTTYTQFLTGWHTVKVEYNERTSTARAALTTTFAAVPRVVDNGVTATPRVSINQPYFGELNVDLGNPSDVILAMSATFTVAQTPGVTYHGQYTNLPNSDLNYGHETCSLVAYSFTLQQGLTIRTPGSWVLAAQWDGTGTPRVTSGDTWSVTTVTAKGTTTVSGTF